MSERSVGSVSYQQVVGSHLERYVAPVSRGRLLVVSSCRLLIACMDFLVSSGSLRERLSVASLERLLVVSRVRYVRITCT